MTLTQGPGYHGSVDDEGYVAGPIQTISLGGFLNRSVKNVGYLYLTVVPAITNYTRFGLADGTEISRLGYILWKQEGAPYSPVPINLFYQVFIAPPGADGYTVCLDSGMRSDYCQDYAYPIVSAQP